MDIFVLGNLQIENYKNSWVLSKPSKKTVLSTVPGYSSLCAYCADSLTVHFVFYKYQKNS